MDSESILGVDISERLGASISKSISLQFEYVVKSLLKEFLEFLKRIQVRSFQVNTFVINLLNILMSFSLLSCHLIFRWTIGSLNCLSARLLVRSKSRNIVSVKRSFDALFSFATNFITYASEYFLDSMYPSFRSCLSRSLRLGGGYSFSSSFVS